MSSRGIEPNRDLIPPRIRHHGAVFSYFFVFPVFCCVEPHNASRIANRGFIIVLYHSDAVFSISFLFLSYGTLVSHHDTNTLRWGVFLYF